MNISAIACIDLANGIGYQNQLLCKIPEDLAYFKKRIKQHPNLIVGRKTYETIKGFSLFEQFEMHILTTEKRETRKAGKNYYHTNAKLSDAVWETIAYLSDEQSIMVIGGAEIYKEALEHCTTLYITQVFHAFDNVDAYFPQFKREFEMVLASEIKTCPKTNLQFQFQEWIRKTN